MKKVDLAVVMPVYNEAEVIRQVVDSWKRELDELGMNYEIHVYDDGSSDKTLLILQELRDSNSRLVLHPGPNKGHGPTVIRGYRENVGAEWILQIDSDNEIFPSSFPEFWYKRADYDLLIGQRMREKRSAWRSLVSFFSALTIRFLYGTNLSDVNCPFRLLRSDCFKETFESLPDNLFAPNIVICGVAAQRRRRVCAIDIRYQKRQTGKGSLPFFKLFRKSFAAFSQTVLFRFQNQEKFLS